MDQNAFSRCQRAVCPERVVCPKRAVGPERVVLRQPDIHHGFLTEASVDRGHNPVPDTDTGHRAPHPLMSPAASSPTTAGLWSGVAA